LRVVKDLLEIKKLLQVDPAVSDSLEDPETAQEEENISDNL
jgi:hypothetical protein